METVQEVCGRCGEPLSLGLLGVDRWSIRTGKHYCDRCWPIQRQQEHADREQAQREQRVGDEGV